MSALLELFDLIGELARRRYQAGERAFAALGLTHTEARLLSLLSHAGGAAPQDALSNRLTVDRTNAGRALQRLAHAGYIERRKDDADRRANLIQITPKGRKLVAAISKLRPRIAAESFGTLNDRDAETILSLLRQSLPNQLAAPEQAAAEPGRPTKSSAR